MIVPLVLVLTDALLIGSTVGTDSCPHGAPRLACFDELCKDRTCASNEDAVCRVNNCGKCTAEFVDENGGLVECDRDSVPICAGGPVTCETDPCHWDACGGKLFTECRRRRCSCEADHFFYGKKLDCDRPLPPLECPPDEPVVQCLTNLCERVKCVEFPNATCRVSYCGSCKAIFLDEDGNDLNCTATPGDLLTCPTKTIRRQNCGDLCASAKCAADPDAECIVNNCGGCKAEFRRDGDVVDCKNPDPPSVKAHRRSSPTSPKKARLICVVSGDPTPTVTWHKDGKLLRPCASPKFCTKNNYVIKSGKVNKLVIREVSTDHWGRYTCKAKNAHGEDSVNFFVHSQESAEGGP